MNETLLEDEVLARVPQGRRSFVQRMLGHNPFATPVVTSFDMDQMTVDHTAVAANSTFGNF